MPETPKLSSAEVLLQEIHFYTSMAARLLAHPSVRDLLACTCGDAGGVDLCPTCAARHHAITADQKVRALMESRSITPVVNP